MYEAATPEHVNASVEAIREVCNFVAGQAHAKARRTITLRIGHYDHGAFLSPLLNGFTVMSLLRYGAPTLPLVGIDELPSDFAAEALKGIASDYEVDGILEGKSAEVVGPMETDEERPLAWAIVINQPVAVQIDTLLNGVASLLGRTRVVDRGIPQGGVEQFAPETQEADRAAQAEVRDNTRAHGWRGTATQLMSQMKLQDVRLAIRYSNPLLSSAEISARADLYRYTYNVLPAVREAVDKTVTLTSRGMQIRGYTSQAVLRKSWAHVESDYVAQFMAQVNRDAWVCGNGGLDWGEIPWRDIKAVAPEAIVSAEDGHILVKGGDGSTFGRDKMLHIPGAQQVNTALGVSAIEPFVRMASDRSLFLVQLLHARIMIAAPTARHQSGVQHSARAMERTSLDQLSKIDSSIADVLGGITEGIISPPSDLYFPNMNKMNTTVTRVSLRSDRIEGK